MSYKTISVCLDNTDNSINTLKFSLALAIQYDAHLKGMHITYTPPFLYDIYGQITPLLMKWQESQTKKQKNIKESFFKMCEMAGINFDWSNYQSFDYENILTCGRTSDLLILSRYHPSDDNRNQSTSFIGRIVLALGKPLLVPPNRENLPETFGKIIIAWDGSKEAARSIGDALSILKKAQTVKVLSIKKEYSNILLPDLNMGDYLARHNVKVEINEEKNLESDIGEWLISRAKDFKADLIVMGAYGHNRYSELVFGGVTKTLLDESHIPILMSH